MVYYYGGKFDPITTGHISVINRLIEDHRAEISSGEPFKLVVGVKGNDLEGSSSHVYGLGNLNRYDLVSMAVKELIDTKWKGFKSDKGLIHASIDVVFQTCDRTWEYFQSKPEWFPEDGNVTIVLGSDEYTDLIESTDPDNNDPKWLHAKEIVGTYPTESFSRDSFVSSTRVRELLKANPYVEYNEVSDYLTRSVFDLIKKRHLYWQFGDEAYARRKENEFLMSYDMNAFPRPSCTATCLVVSNGQVLLVRRAGHPYMNYWALPGGFLDVNKDDGLEDTALRELNEEVGIGNILSGNFRQFHTYSQKGQDPRGRIVDTVFLFEISRLCVDSSLKAGDDASEYAWWPLDKLPRLAFNHKLVIDDYIRKKASDDHQGN